MLNLCLQEERDKKKRKIRLEMHMEQYFDDGLDAYVWIYDPIPFYYWLFGALVVLAAIAICMFPLWPPTVRYVLLFNISCKYSILTTIQASKQELLFVICHAIEDL